MFCQNCGKELPEGAAFCPECGAKVAETVTPETVETVSTAETVASAAAASTAVFDEENKAVKREETFKEKYFCFQGRLNRKPYILRSILLSIGSGIAAGILGVLLGVLLGDSLLSYVGCAVISAAAFLSALSLCVRRLHDLNRSGLLWLLSFIPVINFFLAIYVIFFKGTEGDNRYGPDPLAR